MAHIAGSFESSHLLVTAATEGSSPLQQKSVCTSYPPSKHLCLPSKAAILILLWTIIVGTTYFNVVGLSAAFVLSNPIPNTNLSQYAPLPYAILAIVMMFYPLSGFIADICCGRLKSVVISLVSLLFCWILWLVGFVVLAKVLKFDNIPILVNNQEILMIVLASFFVFFLVIGLVIGLAGYHANFVQLGLDQLFEAPSHFLSLYIHYSTWAFYLGSLSVPITVYILMCTCKKRRWVSLLAIQVTLPLVLILLLVISYWKRRMFESEPGHQNPYSSVYNILKFAKSHKHPLRRSAFTHCDNYIPSRLDFAKERFGGPFTTEQVENVKTFFRILVVLFAIGPVFALEVPGSYFIAPLFGKHFHDFPSQKQYCSGKFIPKILTVAIGWVVAPIVLLFPLYIWIVFSLLRKKVLKIFTRLHVGIVICLLGVACLLVTDIVGHSLHNHSHSNNHNQSLCVFQVFLIHGPDTYHSLGMPWVVLIPPSLLLGIGPLLVVATTLEFVSAQSPQSMKGLLVGVFFAIRGLFQFLNSIIIIPLSLKQPWASGEMIKHPPVTNCGFVYLVLTSVTGLIGLILFSLAAKRYKHRTRDEGMFRQHDVEEIYDRYMDQTSSDTCS